MRFPTLLMHPLELKWLSSGWIVADQSQQPFWLCYQEGRAVEYRHATVCENFGESWSGGELEGGPAGAKKKFPRHTCVVKMISVLIT